MRGLARILLSVIFIHSGYHAFRESDKLSKKEANAGVPETEELVAKANGATMLTGGVMLGLGILPRLAALVLLITLIPTTLIGHAFWKEETEDGRKHHETHFVKNLGLMGGLLLVMTSHKKKKHASE